MRSATRYLVLTVTAAVTARCLATCEDADSEYSLMNATNSRIWVDIDAKRNHDWRDMPLDPSQSAAFDGVLTHVKVRLRSGQVVEYRSREIRAIRTRAHSSKGDWIVDRSGLRFVPCGERQQIFKSVQKPLADRPNQSLQPTADRRGILRMAAKTVNSAAALALVSGG